MNNSLLAIVAFVAMFLQGCSAAAARTPVELRPLVAVAAAVSMLEAAPRPIPPPPGPPKPGEPCEPCRGTGKLGDGTAAGTVTCVSCGGTGVVPAAAACVSGTCPLVRRQGCRCGNAGGCGPSCTCGCRK